ncbi:MAG: CHAT domain-containing protein [Bacteroidota bacterium]
MPEYRESTHLSYAERTISSSYFPPSWWPDTTSLQASLAAQNRCLLYLSMEGPILIRYLLDGERQSFKELSVNIELQQQLTTYLRLVYSHSLSTAEERQLARLSYELYQQLIGVGEIRLKEKVDLIIGGDLINFPINALRLVPEGENASYFVDVHTLSYHFDFQMRAMLSARQVNPRREQLLAFAPDFERHLLPVSGALTTRKGSALANNQMEVAYLQQLLPGEYLFGAAANRATFDRLASDYSIVHLATHAEADLLDGRRSCIYLSESSEITDSRLYTSDLINYQLNAELVVLSACETGLESYHGTLDQTSLAHSFIAAGAKSVLATAWAVDDRATAEIMASFYTYLKAGNAKDVSLRQAQIDYRRRHSGTDKALPFYWAAFSIIGDPSPLEFYPDFYYDWWKWGVIMAACCLLLWAYRLRSTEPRNMI